MLTAATWLLSAAALASAAPQQQNDLSVSVLIRTASLSGTGFGTAGSDRGDDVFARVTADENFCRAGVGDSALTRPHDYSWELAARIVGRTADTVIVDVTWKQLEGPGAGGPPKSQTVTLHSSERAVLDTFRPALTTGCAAQGTLEVEAGPRARLRPNAVVAAGGGGRSANGAIGGAFGGIASGASGTGSGSSVGAGGRVGGGRGGAGTGFSLREPRAGDLTLRTGAPFNVEIWLVRRLPDGTEHVEAHDRAENIATASKRFGPIGVETPDGKVDVTIDVELRTMARERDPLLVMVNRHESIGWRNSRADTPLTTEGGVTRVGELPGPAEIISLELPASRSMTDRFSVRLKFSNPLLQESR
jgi:hypothetical protein